MDENTENVITPVIISCNGAVYGRPRLVRRRARQTPEQLCEFTFKFKVFVEPGESLPDLEDEFVVRFYEERIRSFFEVDAVYTDKDGEIHRFNRPNQVWWIELTGIGSKAQKPVPVPAPQPQPSFDGPIIDMQLEPAPAPEE